MSKVMSKDFNKALGDIAKGAGIAFGGIILNRFLSFLTKVVVARFLTPSEYGILNLGLSIFSIATTLSVMGMTTGIVRFISYYIGKKDFERAKGVIYSVLKLTLPLSIFFSVLIFIFSKDISMVFHNKKVSNILQILIIALPFWVLAKIYIEANVGLKKIEYSITIQTLLNTTKFLAVTILLLAGFGLFGVSYGYLLAFLISPLIGYYFFNKASKHLKDYIIKSDTMEIFLYSYPLLLSSFSTLILTWTDTLMIGYFKNEYNVGIYSAAYPVAQLLTVFGTSFSIIFLPVITELYSNKLFDELKKIYITATKWIFSVTFPALLLLVFFGRYIIEILFGSKYMSGYPVLLILALGFFTNSVLILCNSIIKSIGRTKFIMIVSYIVAAINVILNAHFIPIYGIIGAAIATTTSLVISSTAYFVYACKLINTIPFSLKFIRSVLASCLALIIVKMFVSIISNLDIFFVTLFSIIYIVSYFILLLLFKFFDYEDIIIIKFIERRTGISMRLFKKIL